MSKKGFTLIELLVVIAIIGMLAGIVLVAMGRARMRARDAKRASDIRAWSTAMTMAYDDPDPDCGGPDAYPKSDLIPNRICLTAGSPGYLTPAPTSTPPHDYIWVDNNGAGACTIAGTSYPEGQWYCIGALLEAEDSCWVATHLGTKKLTGVTACPTTCDCGW